MKSALIILFLMISNSIVIFGQYKVKSPAPKCNLPECTVEKKDSVVIPGGSRGFQTKSPTTKAENIPQKMYHIEPLNALFFVPEAFTPVESTFNIGGAIKYISKVQIFHLETDELIFQTSIPENAWNGKWKDKPQYGSFKYIISIHIDKNTIEQIEGIVQTKNPLN